MKPIIGVLIRYGENKNGTPLEYIFDSTRRAILKMGGLPLLLCPVQDIDYYHVKAEDYPDITALEEQQLNYFLNMCDGLLIPGGDKISPYDFKVLEKALDKRIPILGICLGMQILANYKLPVFQLSPVENASFHSQDVKEQYAHEVIIDKNSLLL